VEHPLARMTSWWGELDKKRVKREIEEKRE
jgi:hypothetical protein